MHVDSSLYNVTAEIPSHFLLHLKANTLNKLLSSENLDCILWGGWLWQRTRDLEYMIVERTLIRPD